MRILYASTEVYPTLKTGGLADVNAALPKALLGLGVDIRLLLPAYPALLQAAVDLQPVAQLHSPVSTTGARVLLGSIEGVPAYLIEAGTLYERPGNPYVDSEGRDWPDNYLQFALLSWTAAHFADGTIGGWRPDIVHAHDWHTGLAPAYLAARSGERPGSVFTVHNLAFQGEFPALIFGELALPASFFSMNGLEYYGHVNYMKSGLHFADRITTVSPTYAREIQLPECGFGMDGVLRARAGALTGILNGVDHAIWNPQTDCAIAARFVTRATRVANMTAVDELIESWTKTLTKNDVAQRMLKAAVPCAAVRTLAEVMNDENMHARGSLQWIDHPQMGRVVLPHSPLVFEGTPRRPIEPSKPLGASNDAIFGEWLGHSAEELAACKTEGVI